MFGRKSRRDVSGVSELDSSTGTVTVTALDASTTSVPIDRIRPEDSVLDELSRAFGTEPDVQSDDGSDPVASATIDTDSDQTAPSPPDELNPRDSDSDVGGSRAGALPVISIGGDDASFGDFDAISIEDARGRVVGPALDSAAPNMGESDSPATGPRASTGSDRVVGPSGRATIAIGGGDGLPDAVYLDDGLAIGDDSGGTVFIDDDGIGDAIAPKDATGRGIEPRLRQRRIGVRRAESRRRLKWVAIGGLVIVIVLGTLTVLGSGLFEIDDVAVSGNVYTDKERLGAVVDELIGTPVLLADTAKAEAELEAISWVDDARVRTKFPDRATIEIRERSPVATMRGADGLFRVLDTEGRVLDVIEGQPVAYVLIAGPGTLDLAAGDFAPIGQASAAALVTKLTPTVRPLVVSIEVTDDGSDLVMNLGQADAQSVNGDATSTIRVRFGSAVGDADQIEKLVRLEKQLIDLPDGTISEINVATDEVTYR